jgi:NAD(P)-dependent dehydrogenase (short-subunit alcohol dehydrogenase family)
MKKFEHVLEEYHRRMDSEDKLMKSLSFTRAGSGIGKAAAIAFAKEGGKDVVCDINDQEMNKTVSEIIGAGNQAIAVECDISDKKSVGFAMMETIRIYGTCF